MFSFDTDEDGADSQATVKSRGQLPTLTSDTASGVSERTHTTHSLLKVTARRDPRLP